MAAYTPDSEGSGDYPQYDVNPDFIPFQHRGWHAVRMRIRDAMEATDQPAARAHKFLSCGDDVFVYQNADDGEVECHGNACGDRFCMVCGQARSYRIARALREKIAESQPLFLTFTIRGKPGDKLAHMIDRLSDAWKELRRLKHWKDRIQGGAIMLEVKYSKSSGGHWHPHYHVLAHGKWIDVAWLRAAWRLITGDSDQVDIQRVRDVDVAMGYVTKYASKPMDSSYTMVPSLLQEAMKTLKGRRLCACFGTWYGTPLNDAVEDQDGEEAVLTNWRFIGTRRSLEYRAAEGDAEAARLLLLVERQLRLRALLSERMRSPPTVCKPPDSSPAAAPLFDSAAAAASGVSPESTPCVVEG